MRVLITGATGFVGRALVLRLLREGHAVSAWVRSPSRARALLGADVQLVDAAGGQPALIAAVAQAQAVVNLAGEPVAGGRFTRRRRARILESRVDFTRRLVDALAMASQRPSVLISASAVGYYGNRGEEPIDEASEAGSGFLADVCRSWEAEATRAEALGLRVMRARLGMVLGLGGGALASLLPLFQHGLGARLGDGRQYVPWMHLDDVVAVLTAALVDTRFTGSIDVVAPAPVTMEAMANALAGALGRRRRLAVPGLVLRLALGEAAGVVLDSQRTTGERLRSLGVTPAFSTLEQALADIVGRLGGVQIERIDQAAPAPVVERAYLKGRRPRYLLRSRVELDAPLDEVFAFFSRPANLGLLTPATTGFQIRAAPAAIGEGGTIDYGLRVAGAPLRWRTVIEHWAPGRCFVDAQARGPYRLWWHEHHFRAAGDRTVMEDRVFYTPPLGILGLVAQPLFVAPQLRAIFGYRDQAIRLRFRAA